MIQGRYVKEGNYVEVKLENGITEIWPMESAPLKELQVFTLKPQPKPKKKSGWQRALIIMSLILPYICLYTTGRMCNVNVDVFTGLLIAYVVWVMLVGYANVRRKKA